MTDHTSISRRSILKLSAAAGTLALATPYLSLSRARASGSITVRTLGGAYEEAARKAYFEPFTAATGILVQTVPANFSKLLAMHRSGSNEIDVVDIGELGIIQLRDEGALEKIDYDSWKDVDRTKIDEVAISEFGVGHTYYSSVIGYNAEAVRPEKAPKNWQDFWNVEAFPGPRMLADIASGDIDLEQALIADGVPLDKLYPLDIERGLASMARIRSSIRKFWDTGALSAQMLTDQEAVMGSIWNTRAQAAIDGGAPLQIVWDGGELRMQCWAIAKGTKNVEAAQQFVAFAMAAGPQAALAELIPNGPANKLAFEKLSTERAKILPNNPDIVSKCFVQNAQWWADNRAQVASEWSKWLLVNR